MSERIILVHGSCHGAWVWYKVLATLRARGYSVEAIDLGGAGADPRRIPEDFSSFREYSQPLLDLVAASPPGEKLVLVGHMFGGLSLALAMDAFPEKIAVAVFLSAMMPDTTHPPSYPVVKHLEKFSYLYKDIEFTRVMIPAKEEALSVTRLGPEFLATNLYQNCNLEDVTLGSLLMRPTSLFKEELGNEPAFSLEGYGSVRKVYIVSQEDAAISADFQRWMIQNNPVEKVMEIEGADHMAMLSKPEELCGCLENIVKNYGN
ncbi:hypothetical protein HPP92_016167 [Vanilla planifolia]|uniref:AB hydrolase-1 domain-containing protein n=1 Tax=Vanilla planifolia TaxID=51239 RepID=A0A835QE99_VANPL|nr:hypothetical protein HPP92_016768 [Vanilla planifolia]KAG0471621.1 hypothetical protein HPP92_016167 [Vanilla planifolia]